MMMVFFVKTLAVPLTLTEKITIVCILQIELSHFLKNKYSCALKTGEEKNRGELRFRICVFIFYRMEQKIFAKKMLLRNRLR